LRGILALIFALIIVTAPALADTDIMDGVRDAVPEEGQALLDTDTDTALEKIGGYFMDKLVSVFRPCVKKAVSLVCVAALCSVLGIISVSEKLKACVDLCGCAAVSIIAAGEVGSYVDMGTKAIADISDFSKAILPAMCTTGAACGAIGSASARFAASALFIDLFVTAAQRLILPVVLSFLAVTIAACAFSSRSIAGIARIFKWVATSLMILLCLVFTAYLSLSSAVAAATDAVAAKAAKTVIASALPVVGGIISDAASSVIAGAELLRSSVGVLGMIAVLSICAGPFAVLGVSFLAYKAAGLIVSALDCGKISELIGGIGTAFGMILGLVGCGGIMLVISIMSCIRAVSVV